MQGVNRERVHVSVRAQMILRDNVLKIRFEFEERQVKFLSYCFGTFKNFLLDERNVFFAITIINRAVVVNSA